MIYLGLESNPWRTEGISGGKVDVESEYSSFVSVDLLIAGGEWEWQCTVIPVAQGWWLASA